jgi:hypothetical protein
MPRRRILLALLAALVVGTAFTTTVANAQTGEPPRVTGGILAPAPTVWPWPIICTNARFTGSSLQPLYNGHLLISLSGMIEPCPGEHDPGAMRSFTTYSPSGGTLSPYIHPLRDPDTGSYAFEVSGERPTSTTAVCVIDALFVKTKGGDVTGYPRRRACVAISHTGTGYAALPIPTGDPRVLATVQPSNDHTDPWCTNCL